MSQRTMIMRGALISLAALLGPLRGAAGQSMPCVQLVTVPRPDLLDQFGRSPLVVADTLFTELTPRPSLPDGGVGVFSLDGLSGHATLEALLPVPPASGIGFSFDFAADADQLAIGSGIANNGTGQLGLVRVISRTSAGWTTSAEIIPPAGSAPNGFGAGVGLHGATLVVGDPMLQVNGLRNVGQLFVFRRSSTTWTLEARIPAPQTGQQDLYFGTRVAIDEDRIAVSGGLRLWLYGKDSAGAWILEDDVPLTAGFDLAGDRLVTATLNTSTQQTSLTLRMRDPATGRWDLANGESTVALSGAGTPIDFDGSTVALGVGPTTSGRGVVVRWAGDHFDELGSIDRMNFPTSLGSIPVALWRDRGLTTGGFPIESRGESLLHFDPRCEVRGVYGCPQRTVNGSGDVGTLLAFGSPQPGGTNVAMEITSVPPHTFGMLVASPTPGLTIMPGGSGGDLCLAGAIGRFDAPGEILRSDASGFRRFDVDLDDLPTPFGRRPATPGETWYFQVWHRDTLPGALSHFTNSVSITTQP